LKVAQVRGRLVVPMPNSHPKQCLTAFHHRSVHYIEKDVGTGSFLMRHKSIAAQCIAFGVQKEKKRKEGSAAQVLLLCCGTGKKEALRRCCF